MRETTLFSRSYSTPGFRFVVYSYHVRKSDRGTYSKKIQDHHNRGMTADSASPSSDPRRRRASYVHHLHGSIQLLPNQRQQFGTMGSSTQDAQL